MNDVHSAPYLVICENAQEHNALIVRALTHAVFVSLELRIGVYYLRSKSGDMYRSADLYTACDLFLSMADWWDPRPSERTHA